MPSPKVLKFPRSDDPDSFVLASVSSAGKDTLDLRLVATEGENPYVCTIKQKHVQDLKAKNYKGSDAEWSQILGYALSQNADPGRARDLIQGLEVVASIAGKEGQQTLTILLRKRIEDITQRLGTITLDQNDEEPIQLLDWCGQALDQAKTLDEEVASLKAKYQSSSETLAKLNTQLEDLIKAKKEHEEELIGKLVALLNEKKLKVRNQQRLLASAKIDPKKAKELETSAQGRGRQAGASSRSKRKAIQQATEVGSSDDDFERMDIDPSRPDGQADEQEQSEDEVTPSPTEDEEDDNEGLPLRTRSREGTLREPAADAEDTPQTSSPPPPRDLPFGRRTAGKAKEPQEQRKRAGPEPAQEDAETEGETDDDEL